VAIYFAPLYVNLTLCIPLLFANISLLKLLQIESLCSNASSEGFPLWPVVSSVSPIYGAPGELVTISGAGFSENVTVVIHKECSNVTVVNDTVIIATLPDWDQMGYDISFSSPSLPHFALLFSFTPSVNLFILL
jgi:hypothetical protein